jgi:hypothetical protein
MNWDFDIEEEDDILAELEDMFEELDIDRPTPDQLYQMYGVFLNDFVKNPIILDGIELSYNKDKSKHPICRGKMKAFEHIITRESKHKGKRDFDRERANKIHWIKPIIENVNDARIKYFEKYNEEGKNQRYYWYQDKGFIVIVRELDPEYFLITAFAIDAFENINYKRDYDRFNEK